MSKRDNLAYKMIKRIFKYQNIVKNTNTALKFMTNIDYGEYLSNLFEEEYQFKMIDGLSKNKTLLPNYQQEFFAYKNLVKELENFTISKEMFIDIKFDDQFKELLILSDQPTWKQDIKIF